MSVKPISPDDVSGPEDEPLPDEIIEIYNECVKYAYRSGEARFSRQGILYQISERLKMEQRDVENAGYLDIERVRNTYSNGWGVEESREHSFLEFVFTKE